MTLLAPVLLVLAGCSAVGAPPAETPPPEMDRPDTVIAPVPEPEETEEAEEREEAADTAAPVREAPDPDPPEPTDALSGPPLDAESILRGMSLREKAGQMVMPIVLGDYAPEGTPGHDRVQAWVEEYGVGGVIVSVGTPTDVAVKLNDFQRHARLPLLVGADLETGAGFRLKGAIHIPTNILLGGATDFPTLMAVGATGDPQLAYRMGEITAREARAVGIHVPFAPVLDVNSNPQNPIINVRAFGEDPAAVGRLGAAMVRGIQDHGAIATGKHFPGHGDTETDSHLALPIIRADRARLDSVELRPFREAIDVGIGGIMTAHITVPALNGRTGDPSTLSRPVLSGLLRGEMGFDGLLFTDAMDMNAIDRGYGREEATIRAVEAGADVILMPPSVPTAVGAIEGAVRSGRIPEARVDDSVLRILREKERLGLFRERLVDLNEIPGVVGIPAHTAVADEIARRSMTLLRNQGDLLPLLGTRTARVLSVTYRRERDLLAARWFDGRLRGTYPRLTTTDVHRDTGAPVYEGLLRQARQSNLVVVSFYVTALSYQGSVAIPPSAADFVKRLEAEGIPHVVISFGNPYLLSAFPDVRAYLLAWSGSEASQRAAADALLGRFDVGGRTPTRLPPYFEIGDGLWIPAGGARGGDGGR